MMLVVRVSGNLRMMLRVVVTENRPTALPKVVRVAEFLRITPDGRDNLMDCQLRTIPKGNSKMQKPVVVVNNATHNGSLKN
jgi:hypothetical protein